MDFNVYITTGSERKPNADPLWSSSARALATAHGLYIALGPALFAIKRVMIMRNAEG